MIQNNSKSLTLKFCTQKGMAIPQSSSLLCISLSTTWYEKGHRNTFTLSKDIPEIKFPKKHLTVNNIVKSVHAGHPCSIKSCVRHDRRSTTAPDNTAMSVALCHSFLSGVALNGVEDFLFSKSCKNYHWGKKRQKKRKKIGKKMGMTF